MKMITTHSHLLTNPASLNKLVENGLFEQIWMLQLPHSISISNVYPHPSTEQELLDVAKRFKGVLLPFKWIDYRLGPEQIDKAIEDGFVGFKGFCPQYSYDDDRYLPIYERINQYKTCIVFHTGYVSTPTFDKRAQELCYKADNMRPSCLRELARFFPETTFIAAHFGFPWENELLDMEVRNCPNIYIDLSGGQWEKMKIMIEQYALLPAQVYGGREGVLAERLLFGADAYIGHPQLHQDIDWYCREKVMTYFTEKISAGVPWGKYVEAMLHDNAAELQKRHLLC